MEVLYLYPHEKGIFAGTLQGGLVLLDRLGRIKSIYDQANGLKDTTITAIYKGKDGFFTGTSSGLYFYDKRIFIRLPGFPTLQVNDLKERKNNLYIATPLGLYELSLSNKALKKIEIPGFKGSIITMEVSPDFIYLGTSQGLIRYKPETAETRVLGVKEGLPVSVILSLKISDGLIYIGTQRGLRIANLNLLMQNLSLPAEVKKTEIQTIEVGRGFIFAGTSKGVVRMNRNNLLRRVVFASLSPLTSNRITALAKNKTELFIGTANGFLLYNEKLNYLSEIIKGVVVNDVVQLSDDYYIATNTGLYRYNITQKKVLESFDVRRGLFHNQVLDLLVYEDKLILATKLGVQVYEPLRRKFEAYFLRDVISIFLKEDIIYAGTVNGLYRKAMLAADFTRITFSGAPASPVRSIVSTKKGLLLSTGRSVLELNLTNSSFSSYSLPFSANILKLAEEEDYIFYLTENGFYIQDNIYGTTWGVNSLDGLPSSTVLSFLKDGNKVYLGTSNGLFIGGFNALSRSLFFDTTFHPLRRIIENASVKGMVAGFPDGSFKPNHITTRAQFAVLLIKALDISPSKPIYSSFTDVSLTHWASPFIEELVKRKVLIAGGRFYPNSEIKREESAEWVALALKLPFQRPARPSFKDVASTYPYYLLIEAVHRERIFMGTPAGNFLPRFPLSRAEAVTILMRIRDEKP
ncbi:MAG: S-layer protein [candidate division WS2 bacterium]|nr:S-layer protein [Candidatus Lithacetigena glycinireducens]